jgi:hypothetical protein
MMVGLDDVGAFTCADGNVYQVDEIHIEPADAIASVTSLEAVSVLAANISELTITNETPAVPSATPSRSSD